MKSFQIAPSLQIPDDQEKLSQLSLRLSALQRKCRELAIPVILVFEGFDAAGKGTLINRLALALDARGFQVHPIFKPSREEKLRPFLWRFWNRIPAAGRIAIFDRSWYGRVLAERVQKLCPTQDWQRAYEEINAFERQLVHRGTVIIKFFLKISKRTQKKRFQILESSKATRWKITREDWQNHSRYPEFAKAAEEMIQKTHDQNAPWKEIPSRHKKKAAVAVFQEIADILERAVQQKETGGTKEVPPNPSSPFTRLIPIKPILSAAQEKDLKLFLKQNQQKLRLLEHRVFKKRIPVILVFEGHDAAGKGGTIARLAEGMDPRGYEVIPIAAPDTTEKNYPYFWRFWNRLPKAGHLAIFDRSWYGRVLVERVEGFCSVQEWQNAYGEIRETERQWAHWGALILKFWLNVSPEEQLRRFQDRESQEQKRWKITEEDWRNREKRPLYEAAVLEMLEKTSSEEAPWFVIHSDNKKTARAAVLECVVREIQKKLDSLH